tara:strand:+ start:356 stop:574 length:219 start_codon:yes stop_codon:yes gene_type:complete
MTDLERFEELVDNIWEIVFGTERRPRPKRARTKKGTYRADDKSTPNVNEAYVGGKAPKKLLGIKNKSKNRRK